MGWGGNGSKHAQVSKARFYSLVCLRVLKYVHSFDMAISYLKIIIRK